MLNNTSRWRSFTAGMAVGMATGLLGVGLAVVAERNRRRSPARMANAPGEMGVGEAIEPATTAASGLAEQELDDELAQTFPASDPLPHSHQVD